MSAQTIGATVGETYPRDVGERPMRVREPRRFGLGDETLFVQVRESARARTSRIIVGPRRPLEVIVPAGTPDSAVDALLEGKRDWVERKVASARTIAARPARLGLDGPGVVWLDGRPVPVEYEPCRRAVAELRDGRLLVGGDEHDARRAIVRWYRREARRRIAATFAREKERLGLDYASLSIRDQRTRWGSCSRKGHRSFSGRLALAPEEVRNYVVVHELYHLREPSHSKVFWRFLGAATPGWQQQARWLSEHGRELHGYDAATALANAAQKRQRVAVASAKAP